jgi:hypothetical protein
MLIKREVQSDQADVLLDPIGHWITHTLLAWQLDRAEISPVRQNLDHSVYTMFILHNASCNLSDVTPEVEVLKSDVLLHVLLL